MSDLRGGQGSYAAFDRDVQQIIQSIFLKVDGTANDPRRAFSGSLVNAAASTKLDRLLPLRYRRYVSAECFMLDFDRKYTAFAMLHFGMADRHAVIEALRTASFLQKPADGRIAALQASIGELSAYYEAVRPWSSRARSRLYKIATERGQQYLIGKLNLLTEHDFDRRKRQAA